MQLLALDASFSPVRYLKYLDLAWNREYYRCGDFSVQIAANEYRDSMAYIYTKDRPETGIIQKVEFTGTTEGDFIQLSGFFLENILNYAIIYPTFYANGIMDEQCTALVNEYKEEIPLLTVSPALGIGTVAVWQETGGCLSDVLYNRLQQQELSFRCDYDYDLNQIVFSIWQGLNRTQEQSVNNFVVFSKGFRNIASLTLNNDISNYKNFALVAGSGEGDARITVTVDLSGGAQKRKLFVDAKDLAFDTSKQTLDEYEENLRHRGLEKLVQDYAEILNVEIDASQTAFVYLRDFNIGDKVDVILNDVGLSLECRVISAHETINKNTHVVTIELGNKVLTDFKKARLS